MRTSYFCNGLLAFLTIILIVGCKVHLGTNISQCGEISLDASGYADVLVTRMQIKAWLDLEAGAMSVLGCASWQLAAVDPALKILVRVTLTRTTRGNQPRSWNSVQIVESSIDP